MRRPIDRRQFVAGAAASVALAGCGAPATRPGPALAAPPALPTHEVLERLAFGSCADQAKPQPIWDGLLASRPQLVLFGGDNVYASRQPWSEAQLREAYALQAAQPGFARVRAQVPHLAIWDDHDYGLNDAGADFVHKAASKQAFLDFWKVAADDPRRRREGLHGSWTFGPPGRQLRLIVLDTRWWRSPWQPTDQRAPGRERYVPVADAARTMLGEAQWAWLRQELAEPAQLRLVYSSVQVLAEGHGFERWGNFPLELDRLFRLVQQTRAGGVILLSGDRHVGALYREARASAPYPLYEATASGWTHPWRDAAEPGPNRIGGLVTDLHFGMVEVDWPGRRVRLQLRGVAGQLLREQSIGFAELQVT